MIAFRLLLVFCIVLLSTLSAGQDADVDDDNQTLVRDAALAYEQGDFDQAIDHYLTLINRGVNNADVYFNLGNAYYEFGQLGYALAFYLRAQAIHPRSATLQQQIEAIRAERVDYQRDSQYLLDRLADSTHSLLTLRELAVIGFVLWSMMCGLGMVWLQRRSQQLRVILIMGVIIACMVNGLLFARLYGDGQRSPAVIIRDQVVVQSGPGDAYLALYPLYGAAEVRILEQRDLWIRFVLPDGRQGWLPRDVVVIV